MKLKIKFDQKTILDFLLQNVEKIVLGVIVLLTFFILYSSLSHAGRFDKAPEQLRTEVNRARRDLESTTWDGYIKEKETTAVSAPTDSSDPTATPANATLTVNDYVGQAKKSRVAIEEKPYLTSTPWDPRLFEKRPLRDAPSLFAVQELRASPGIGAFRITETGREETAQADRADRDAAGPGGLLGMGGAAAAGGERTRAKRWIVVTGLVPIEKQEHAYADAFQQSLGYDPQKDYPVYLGYWIERVEVENTGDAVPDWSKAKTIVSSEAMRAAMREWSSSRESEVVAQDYLEERLVFPLGPLVNRIWDATVAHEPEIPLLKTNEPTRGGLMPSGGPAAMTRGTPRVGGLLGGPGMLGPGAAGRHATSDTDVEDTPFGNGEKQAEETTTQETRAVDPQLAGPPKFKLFRFFDFDIEPGKHYVYRVCLGMKNPNYGEKAAYLKKPDLAKDSYLKTKWSDPTPIASAPRDTRVLLASVKKAARGNTDSSAEVLLTTWMHRKGVEVYKTFTVTRGQLANFSDEEAQVVGTAEESASRTTEGRTPREGRDAGPAPAGPLARPGGGLEELGHAGGRETREATRGRERDREKDKEKDREKERDRGLLALTTAGSSNTYKTNFNSGAVAIDFRGGEKLPGRRGAGLTSAGEILLFDLDGILVVHNELDDDSARKDVTTPKQSIPGGMRGGPGGLMPGMPGLGPGGLTPRRGPAGR